MPVLNTTAHLHHRTVLPPSATSEKALSLMRNHDLLIRLDPDLSSYETLQPPANAANPETKYYKVTDTMHTLPAHLWDTTVSFHAEITDIEKGVEWVIRAPLGLVQRSLWTVEMASEKDEEVEEGEREKRLVLVEDVEIQCSRLLVGTAKGKCEENWKGVHKRWLENLEKLGA